MISTILYKGINFFNFLSVSFIFIIFWKETYAERKAFFSNRGTNSEQILSFWSRPIFRSEVKLFWQTPNPLITALAIVVKETSSNTLMYNILCIQNGISNLERSKRSFVSLCSIDQWRIYGKYHSFVLYFRFEISLENRKSRKLRN